ncbi:unnamed protein product [Brachionus calyciflorus]|uniref:Bcl-2 Bcl-2 homology region 1-3 domain-containing protein n=1 Tax=Brachionus calyciflorus TaxID=104777 RepID=A0A813W1N3_9BILA|nr:unnamed protein product [Brachionus calyciflorus]
MTFFETQTKNLLSDYISWRLTKASYDQFSLINKNNLCKNSRIELCLIMRQLAYEFERRYNTEYLPLANQFDLTELNFSDTLNTVINELFQTNENNESDSKFDCNWGRIIGLFAFIGCLVMHLYEHKRPNLIIRVLDHMEKYLTKEPKMFLWFEQNNFWDGFIESFNQSEQILNKKELILNDLENNSESFLLNNKKLITKLSHVFGFTLGTVSLLALGYVYFKRLKNNF